MKKIMKKSVSRYLLLILAAFMACIFGSRQNVSAATVLKADKTVKGRLTEQKPAQKYKIKAGKRGYIKITMEHDAEDAFGGINVYDSSGTEAGYVSFSEDKDKSVGYVPVKPGTYTVEVEYKMYADLMKEEAEWAKEEGADEEEIEETEKVDYKLNYRFYSVQEGTYARERKNAPLLKKGREVSGLIFRDTKMKNGNAALYKYTISKKTKVKFHLNIRGAGMRMMILNSKGKPLTWDEEDNSMYLDKKDSTYWYDQNESNNVNLDAGTYYFAIRPIEYVKNVLYSCGFYKITIE